MRKTGTLFMVTFLLLIASIGTIGLQNTEGAREVRGINIDVQQEKGQDVFFVNDTENFKVEILGRFQADGEVIKSENADNWTLKTETNADATIEPKDQDSNVSNRFSVNVTVHGKGKANLNFTAYCTKDDSVRYSTRQMEIKVVEPESVSISVDNPTSYEIEETDVNLYIDGELINTKTIKNLGPDESRKVKFNWSSSGFGPGEHKLEIKTDYGIEGSEEKVHLSRTFYIEEETNTGLYAGIAAVGIGAAVVIFLLFRRKRKRRRRPW